MGLPGVDRVFVSIMAGVTVQTLQDAVGSMGDVVRVMPNTPALCKAGAACYVANDPLQSEGNKTRIEFVEKMFKAIGICHQVYMKNHIRSYHQNRT